MDFSNLKNKLLIVLCVLVVFLPFYLVTPVLADSESVELTNLSNVRITQNSNYFSSYSGASTTYFQVEPGYKYFITTTSTSDRIVVVSSDQPDVNVTYTIIGSIDVSESDTYTFIATNNNYYAVNGSSSSFVVTREKIGGMNEAVVALADTVSPNAFWGIFDISINYIVVVVVFAFGVFIIFKLIRKLSKGNEGL